LPQPVGPEDAEKLPLGHDEVEAAQHLDRLVRLAPEGLHEPPDLDRRLSAGRHLYLSLVCHRPTRFSSRESRALSRRPSSPIAMMLAKQYWYSVTSCDSVIM
jgi:hypothetical protein